LLWLDGDKNAIVIDPGDDPGSILIALDESGLTLTAMLCTHGHIDHIAGAEMLIQETGAEFYISEDDEWLVKELPRYCTMFGLPQVKSPAISGYIKDGQTIKKCGMEFQVIATPGHTPGGVCLKIDNHIFVGDTLFQLSIG